MSSFCTMFENCVNYAHSKGHVSSTHAFALFENCVNYAHSKGNGGAI